MSNITPKRYRRKSTVKFPDPSLTEQSHAQSCKIQNIMSKYQQTGILTHVNTYQGTYMDMSGAPDYHEAQNIIAEANSMFESVPSSLRAKFNNDAAQFIEFMQNEENREKMEAMGLDSSHLPPKQQEPQPNPTSTKPAKRAQKPKEEQLDIEDP